MQNAKCKAACLFPGRWAALYAYACASRCLLADIVVVLQVSAGDAPMSDGLLVRYSYASVSCCFTPRVAMAHATCGNGSRDVWQWLTRRVAVNDATLNHFYCHAWHFRLRPDCTFFLLLIRYFSHFFLLVSYYCSTFALLYNKKHSLTTNKKTL